ncbi:MAG: oligoendopeptidase F [Mycoplasmoidaceae bacterium]
MHKYDWNLEPLLENETLEELFEKWKKMVNNLLIYKDNFCDSKKNFLEKINLELNHSKIVNRLTNYIYNNFQENNKDIKWNEWIQKIQFVIQEYSKNTSSQNNIIIENESKILEYLKDKRLSQYVRGYKLLFKNKHRILSEKEEKLISELSVICQGFESIYSSIVNSTIKYLPAKNNSGKEIKLESMAKVFELLRSKDSVLRKNTWINFSKVYFDFRFSLTQTLIYNYKMLNSNAKIRKYDSYIHESADEDEISIDFIYKIYKGVENFKDYFKRYRSMKNMLIKREYNLKKIDFWDSYLEISKPKTKWTIKLCQEYALKALKCFGDEYIKIVKRAFDENWISWLHKDGKHSGAYSIGGTFGLKQYYISMNFDYTINSLYTLVHELGHSLNSYFYGKKQTVHCSCSIFYAEISSITNEIILSMYLLENTKTKKEKLYIIDKIISGFFATTSRQIVFSNFEHDIIMRDINKETITWDLIKDKYSEMIKKYLGDYNTKVSNEFIDYSLATILRVDHFYAGNFYVYKYAIGQICAFWVAKKLYEGDKEIHKKYLKFLESGSSLSPIETIKLLGIDFEKNDIWDECQNVLNYFITEYEKLIQNNN